MTVSARDLKASNQPAPLAGPSCWTGEVMAHGDWFRQLDTAELDALQSMVGEARTRVGDDPTTLLNMTARDFSVGAFAKVLAEVEYDLCHGKGFSVIRALPVQQWSPIETMIAYWGIGCQLGVPLPNNADGDMIGHVVDLGADYQQANIRGYDTNAKLSYHVDQCDIVGLLCRQPARSGGVSKLVSTAAVHNEILARNRELLAVLKEPFVFSWMGEQQPGCEPWYKAPIFDFVDGSFNCSAGINHIRKGHLLPGISPLSKIQVAALELFEQVSEEIEFSMDFMPGDIQFLNNGLVAHTRTGFEDWPEKERRRHLLRIWLRAAKLHQGAAYFENWRNGVPARDNHRHIRYSP